MGEKDQKNRQPSQTIKLGYVFWLHSISCEGVVTQTAAWCACSSACEQGWRPNLAERGLAANCFVHADARNHDEDPVKGFCSQKPTALDVAQRR